MTPEDESLLENGIMDSVGSARADSHCGDSFGLSVADEDVTPSNFDFVTPNRRVHRGERGHSLAYFNARYHSTSHNTAAITTIMTMIQKKKNISLSKTPKTNIAMIIIKAMRMIRAMAFNSDPSIEPTGETPSF
jgi:hypothetical protein